MVDFADLDFEPIAKQVYDAFLLLTPGVPVDGLFVLAGEYFIVSPGVDATLDDGRTVAEWFENDLRPSAMPVSLVRARPDGATPLSSRSAAQSRDGFGVVRLASDSARDIALLLPKEFPLISIAVEDRTRLIVVSRELLPDERAALESVLLRVGDPLPFVVRLGAAVRHAPTNVIDAKMALQHSRFREDLPQAVRSLLEADEDFWRAEYGRLFEGVLDVQEVLGERRARDGEACLVPTTFAPFNIRSYLSLYDRIVLVLPLRERVDSVLSALGISRRELIELVSRKKLHFVAPQSVERYDEALLADIVEVDPNAVTASRRLAAAAHAESMARNPLLFLPGSALDRRSAVRALRRLGEQDAGLAPLLMSLAEGLSRAWPSYEYSLHVRGAMASNGGPLASVGRALAQRLTGKDYFIELGAAVHNVEWAAAFGAHLAPFEGDGYSELGHSELLVALHSGVPRGVPALARASHFKVAEDLLVIDNDADVVDFVTALADGDLARFRTLVRGVARPGRSASDIAELVELWNRQVRAYERRPDRIKSMGLGGLVLGALGKIAGAPDVVSLSSAILPALPALLTVVQEDLAGDKASIGAVIDAMNARLAGVHRDAVLLARMKKTVKGMKK